MRTPFLLVACAALALAGCPEGRPVAAPGSPPLDAVTTAPPVGVSPGAPASALERFVQCVDGTPEKNVTSDAGNTLSWEAREAARTSTSIRDIKQKLDSVFHPITGERARAAVAKCATGAAS